MNHSFSVVIATRFTIEKAILIENLAFWINKNIANKTNFKDGHYWTFNSAEAFAELFPYMSSSSISRWLRELENDGVIKSGKYNKLKYDKTKWYTIIDKDILIHYTLTQNEQSITQPDSSESQAEQPIPDINTDVTTDVNLTTTIPKEYGVDIELDTTVSVEFYLKELAHWWNCNEVDNNGISHNKIHRAIYPNDDSEAHYKTVTDTLQRVVKSIKKSDNPKLMKFPLRYLKKCLNR